VKPGNDLLAKWDALPVGTPLGTYRIMAQYVANSDDTFARALTAGKWPANAKAPVTDLIKGMLKDRIYWLGLVRSSSVDQLISLSNAQDFGAVSSEGAADATAVRYALGLAAN
jgi:hypothetical protein